MSILKNNFDKNLNWKCVAGTSYGILNFSLGIAMVVIGVLHSETCNIQDLTTYLQVLGGLMVTMSIIWNVMTCISSGFYQDPTGEYLSLESIVYLNMGTQF